MSGSFQSQVLSKMDTLAAAWAGVGFIDLNPAGGMTLASTGGALAVFADSANNPSVAGIQVTNSEVWTVRWNNAATFTGIARSILLPRDLDGTYPINVKLLAGKTGATDADDMSFTIGAYFVSAGDLWDADADCGGVTNVMDGTTTAKTLVTFTRAIAASDVPDSGPSILTVTIAPTAGVLGTDDGVLAAAWLEYTRKSVST